MKLCEKCDECVYICEGDYACIKEEEPRIVICEHSIPTKDYRWCENKEC